MSNVELGVALSGNARTEPIHQGRVEAQGLDLKVTKVHPSEMFWRQLHFQEFEVPDSGDVISSPNHALARANDFAPGATVQISSPWPNGPRPV